MANSTEVICLGISPTRKVLIATIESLVFANVGTMHSYRRKNVQQKKKSQKSSSILTRLPLSTNNKMFDV